MLQDLFQERIQKGGVIYIESTREQLNDGKYEFDLAYCPALVKRVSDERHQREAKSAKTNPFLPPDPKTLIKSIQLDSGAAYNIFFNKYCVAPMHLLLTTAEFETQDCILNWDDFVAVKQVADEFAFAKSEEKDWMIFYNCGILSGASQYHKHIQLMMVGKDGQVPLSISDMEEIYGPRHFCAIPNGFKGDELLKEWYHSYTKLMTYVEPGRSTNILFTKTWMLVVPRKQLGFGDWNPNSLIFAGYLLSRSDEETKMIKELGPINIIKTLGCINNKK
jgi:sulfate adenylyltransferase (ADP) / ATP adenylyltransferase